MKTAPSYVVPCSAWHLVYLVENMRADEIEQYMALSGADEYRQDVVISTMLGLMLAGPAFTVLAPDEQGRVLPISAGGYTQVIPGVWNSWMVGTQTGWEKFWRRITIGTRWVMDFMFEQMGARRLQTNALVSRDAACWWYQKSLKMAPEGVWVAFGKNGEDVACFARVAKQPVRAETEDA
jgi:hypothetical protein